MNVVYFIFQQTMFFAIPLLIVALGGMFSERSGVVNMALEVIMTMGAFTLILLLILTGVILSGHWQFICGILVGMVLVALFLLF